MRWVDVDVDVDVDKVHGATKNSSATLITIEQYCTAYRVQGAGRRVPLLIMTPVCGQAST